MADGVTDELAQILSKMKFKSLPYWLKWGIGVTLVSLIPVLLGILCLIVFSGEARMVANLVMFTAIPILFITGNSLANLGGFGTAIAFVLYLIFYFALGSLIGFVVWVIRTRK